MGDESHNPYERLLAWLDDDPKTALEKFENLRKELIDFFAWRRCDDPEHLANKTIDQVATSIVNLTTLPPNPNRYFFAAARRIYRDYLRRDKPFVHEDPTSVDAEFLQHSFYLDHLLDFDAWKSQRAFRDAEFLESLVDDDAKRLIAKSNRSRVVSTGFSSFDNPDQPLDRRTPLQTGTPHYFWLEIGKPQKGSIEVTPTEIPDVPATTRLTVVLFNFKDGFDISPHADTGVLEVQTSGLVRVVRQPGENTARSKRLDRRLFFPVRTPAKRGTFRFRCNIYSGQLLLQSRIVEARVTSKPRPSVRKGYALNARVDYKISRQLNPAHINRLNEHRLSVLLNENEDGTHSFHFYGAKGDLVWKQEDVTFREGELGDMLDQARGTFRLASWGDTKEWRPGVPYKYADRKPDLERLKHDLINFARWGYDFYTLIRGKLVGGEDEDEAAKFEALLLEPGSIQFAMKESPRYVLPAAMIYDYRLDSYDSDEAYSLCPHFVKAFNNREPFETLDCLKGQCPSRGDATTVCPSGFWGFRHYIGLPLSVHNGPDIAAEISVNGDLRVAAGVATDLELLKPHETEMKKLRSDLKWRVADDRLLFFELLKDSPHLVYLYCHGGLLRNAPYLQIGPKEKPGLIGRSNFYTYKIRWQKPRPLVFINGCHTTAVAPTQALEFITPLVTYSRCAGVIGTDITIFEELATVFAEDCLRRFLRGDSLGSAVRNARLTLLKEGNPLGLVYMPFAISGLTVVDESATN